ncbi:hypothetical protein RIF29_06597 [Crotalaria pallida]|uniref:Uncharacterized protein n=1 Tax=Crotalaria pallida TaxID=3830 RepID=A0AAN9J4X8_CROPI
MFLLSRIEWLQIDFLPVVDCKPPTSFPSNSLFPFSFFFFQKSINLLHIVCDFPFVMVRSDLILISQIFFDLEKF